MLSYDDLRPYQGSRKLAETRDLKKSESFSVSNKIFLSHRHDDKDWVASVVAYLSDHGIDVYIDSNDPSAPKKTSVETAKLIQKRISECKKFLVLASPGSIDSKWIPWELGYADHAKSLKNIVIIPVGPSNNWLSREYFNLYDVALMDNNHELSVFKPGANSNGMKLKHWVNQ